MELFDNHKRLFTTATLFFVGLTILVAIMPALNNQKNNAPLPGAVELTDAEMKGKAIYIANGCVACHTQQVRNVDMDKVWGKRPSIAADYAGITRTDFIRNTATLMGTERTGPDLTDIGNRQPSKDWNLVHLYNPRIVVKESVMPAYPWLFKVKQEVDSTDVVLTIPQKYKRDIDGDIVATEDALYLIAYLQSLKQTPLPGNTVAPEFLYKRKEKNKEQSTTSDVLDGKMLYTANCQSCHQADGQGLPGAFPSLKGSSVVEDDNLELYVDIIYNGYDARQDYGVMPPVGRNMEFSEHEIAAIINYERSSWGNSGKQISAEDVKKVLEFIKLKSE